MRKEYTEIRKKIEEMIHSADGQSKRLPSLRVMAKEFGCAAPTVMRAVQALVDNGCLRPLRGGGYVSVPGYNIGQTTKVVAVLSGGGMHVFDSSYFCLMRFHASYTLACCGSDKKAGIANILLHSYSDLTTLLKSGIYSGIVLAAPGKQLLQRTEKVCRSFSLPFGVFGADGGGADAAVSFDVEQNFLTAFAELAKLGRRRVLALCHRENNPWNTAMHNAVSRSAYMFDHAEFCVDTMDNIASYVLHNTGGRGNDFDAVIFVMQIPGIYESVCQNAPECLCAIPSFALPLMPDFHGMVMEFDVESAGKSFGHAMYEVLWNLRTGQIIDTFPFRVYQV